MGEVCEHSIAFRFSCTCTIPSMTHTPSGSEWLPSINAAENDPFTCRGTRVSEKGGKLIFLEHIIGMVVREGGEPILIFFV